MDVCQQIAGKALGYPWYKDDQKNFPGATEKDGVCIGDHADDTIVEELASAYTTLRAENERLRGLAPTPATAEEVERELREWAHYLKMHTWIDMRDIEKVLRAADLIASLREENKRLREEMERDRGRFTPIDMGKLTDDPYGRA